MPTPTDFDWQPWAIFLLSSASAALGWVVGQLFSAVKELRKDLDDLRVHLARDYPSYDRIAAVMQPIQDQLNRIEAAMAHKVDKV